MANVPLKTIKFPGLDDTYTVPQVDTTLAVTGAAADAKKTGDEIGELKEALTSVSTTLATKADKSGVVASAEQLLSDVGTEDKAPYLFRATPYDSTRVDEEVVGATVGWNQLYKTTYTNTSRGVTVSVVTGEVTITGTSSSTGNGPNFAWTNFKIEPGHKVLVRKDFNLPTGDYICDQYNVDSSTDIVDNIINIKSDTGYLLPQLRVTNTDVTYNVNGHLMVFDLTAWFGSTIADYAYTLEQATAGSGVSFIKALLPGGYIPYSAPKMESVSGLSAHVMRGFNQWDEEWEVGKLNTSTGANQSGSDRIRSKNYIPVLPSTSYYFKAPNSIYFCWYDANQTFIGTTPSDARNASKTTPSNAHYLRFMADPAYGTTYNHDICINLSDPARNGQYEPYKATTYALDSDLTLRGILKMDADHNVYADGDRYLPDGSVEHRYKTVTLDGTEEWTMYGEGKFFTEVVPINEAALLDTTGDSDTYWSNKYLFHGNGATGSVSITTDKRFFGQRTLGRFWVYDSLYTTVEAWKAALTASPMFIVYPLATPTTETADPYASPQNCAVGGTEEYVYAEGGSGVPVGHNSRYQKNMRSELERVSVAVPDAPSSNGTYTLKATVSSGVVTYAWVSD